MRSARFSDLCARSCSARLPSGSVTPPRTWWPRTSISSSEPPPRSPTMPSGLWMPEMTPSADSFASRGPDRISIVTPQIRSALAMKSGPLRGIAAGGGRDRIDAADLLDPAQRVKAPQRGQRLVDGVGRQQAGGLHLAAEAAQRLLVEDGDEAARHRLIDDETNRVRADVDDRDAWRALARPLHRTSPLRSG